MEYNSENNNFNFNFDFTFVEILGYLLPGTFFTFGIFLIDRLPISKNNYIILTTLNYFDYLEVNLYIIVVLFGFSFISGVIIQLLGSFIRWFIRVTINEPLQGFIKENLKKSKKKAKNNKGSNQTNTTGLWKRLQTNLYLQFKSDFIFSKEINQRLTETIKKDFNNESFYKKEKLSIYDIKAIDNMIENIVLTCRKEGSSKIIKRYDKFIGYVGLCQGLCASSILLCIIYFIYFICSLEFNKLLHSNLNILELLINQYSIVSIFLLGISFVTFVRRLDFNKYADLELALEYIAIRS